MRPMKPPRLKKIFWIKLQLHSLSHGLELATDASNGVVISDIKNNTAACVDGRLSVGDVILQLNDVRIENETADFARQLLQSFTEASTSIAIKVKKATIPTHTSKVDFAARGPDKRRHPHFTRSPSPGKTKLRRVSKPAQQVEVPVKSHHRKECASPAPSHSPVGSQQERTLAPRQALQGNCSIIHLVQDTQTGVGITLKETDPCDLQLGSNVKATAKIHIIESVKEGSPAHRDGRLGVGQRVLAINGRLLTECDRMEIDQFLRENIVQFAVEENMDTIDLSELPPPICPEDIILLPPYCDVSDPVGMTSDTEEELNSNGEFTDITQVVDSENSHISVVLRKTCKGKGLGFSVVGGVDTPQGAMGIHIKTLYPNGLAAECGLLTPGDEIVCINGQSLDGLRHQEAVDLFKGLKRGTVLIKAKRRQNRTRQVCEEEHNLSESRLPVHLQNDKRSVWTDDGLLVQEIKLYKDPVLGLGFDVTANTESGLLKVVKVVKGASADLCKRIRLGDELLKINSIHLKNYRGDQAVQLLDNIPAGPVTLKTRRGALQQTPKEGEESFPSEPPSGSIQQLSGSLLLENYLSTAQRCHDNGVLNEALDVSHCSETSETHHHSTPTHNPPNQLDIPEDPPFDPTLLLPLPEEWQDGSETVTDCGSECGSVSTTHSRSSNKNGFIVPPSRQKVAKHRGHNGLVDLDDILIEFDSEKEKKWLQNVQHEKMEEFLREKQSRTKSPAQVFADGVKEQEDMTGQDGKLKREVADKKTGISASLVVAAGTAVAFTGISKSNEKRSLSKNRGRQDRGGEEYNGVGSGVAINGQIVCGNNNQSADGIDSSKLQDSCSGDRATEGGGTSITRETLSDSCGGHHQGISAKNGTDCVNKEQPVLQQIHIADGDSISERIRKSNGDACGHSTKDIERCNTNGGKLLNECLTEHNEIKDEDITKNGVCEKVSAENDESVIFHPDTVQVQDTQSYIKTAGHSNTSSNKGTMAQRKSQVYFVKDVDAESTVSSRLRRKRTRQDKIEILVIQRLPGEKLGMGINIESKGDESDLIRGVYVENVTPGGAADKAVGGNHGVCLGDEILEINGVSLHETTYLETVNFFKELPLRIILKIKRRPLALRLASQKKKNDSSRNSDKDNDSSHVPASNGYSDVSDSGERSDNLTEGNGSQGGSVSSGNQTQGNACEVDVHHDKHKNVPSKCTDRANTINTEQSSRNCDSEDDSYSGKILKHFLPSSSNMGECNTVLTKAGPDPELSLRDSSSESRSNQDEPHIYLQKEVCHSPTRSLSHEDDSDSVLFHANDHHITGDKGEGFIMDMKHQDHGEEIYYMHESVGCEHVQNEKMECLNHIQDNNVDEERRHASEMDTKQGHEERMSSNHQLDRYNHMPDKKGTQLYCVDASQGNYVDEESNIPDMGTDQAAEAGISPSCWCDGCDHAEDVEDDYQLEEVKCQPLGDPDHVVLTHDVNLELCQVEHIAPTSAWDDVIRPRDLLVRFNETSLAGLAVPLIKKLICGGEGGPRSDVVVSVWRRVVKEPLNRNQDKNCALCVACDLVDCGEKAFVSGKIKPDKNTGITSDESNNDEKVGYVKKELLNLGTNSEVLFQHNGAGEQAIEGSGDVVTGDFGTTHQCRNNTESHRARPQPNHLFAQPHSGLAFQQRSFRCKKSRPQDSGDNRGGSKSVPTSPRKCQCGNRTLQKELHHFSTGDLCEHSQTQYDSAKSRSDHCYCTETDPFRVSLDSLGDLCPAISESGYCSLDKHRQGLVCQALHSASLSEQAGEDQSHTSRIISDVITSIHNEDTCFPGELLGGYVHTMDTEEQGVPPLPSSLPPGEPEVDPPPLPGSLPPPGNSSETGEENTLDIDDCILCCDSESEADAIGESENGSDINEHDSIFNNGETGVGENVSKAGDNTHFDMEYKLQAPNPVIALHLTGDKPCPDNLPLDTDHLTQSQSQSINNTYLPVNVSHDSNHIEEIGSHYADDVTYLSGNNPSVPSQERPEPLGGYDKSQQSPEQAKIITTQATDCYPSPRAPSAIGNQENSTNTANQPSHTHSHITEQLESSLVSYASPTPNSCSIHTNSSPGVDQTQFMDEMQNDNNYSTNSATTVMQSELLCTSTTNGSHYREITDRLQPNGVTEVTGAVQAVAASVQHYYNTEEEIAKAGETPGDYGTDKSEQTALAQDLGQNQNTSTAHDNSSEYNNNNASSGDVSYSTRALGDADCRRAVVVADELVSNSSDLNCDRSSLSDSVDEREADDTLLENDVTRNEEDTEREDMYTSDRTAPPVSSLMSVTSGVVAGSGKGYSQRDKLLYSPGLCDKTAREEETFGENVTDGNLWGEGPEEERKKYEGGDIRSGSFVKQDRSQQGTFTQESSSATLINVIHQGDLELQATATEECHSREINRNAIEPAAATVHGRSTGQLVNGKSERFIENCTSDNEQLFSVPEGNSLLQEEKSPLYVANTSSQQREITEKGIYDCLVEQDTSDKAHTVSGSSHGYLTRTVTTTAGAPGMQVEDTFTTATSTSRVSYGVQSLSKLACGVHSENQSGPQIHTEEIRSSVDNNINNQQQQGIKPRVSRTHSDSGSKPPLPPKPKYLITPAATAKNNNKQSDAGGINTHGGDYNQVEEGISAQSSEAEKPTIPHSSLPGGDEPAVENTGSSQPDLETDQSALKQHPCAQGSSLLSGNLSSSFDSEGLFGNQTTECDDVDMLSRHVLLTRSTSSPSFTDGKGGGASGGWAGDVARPQMMLLAPRRVLGGSVSEESSEADDISQQIGGKQQQQPPLGEPWGVKLRSYTEVNGEATPFLGPRHSHGDVTSGVKLVAEVEKSFGGLGVEITVKDNSAVVASLKPNTPASNLGVLRVGDIVLAVNGKPLSGLNNIRVQQLIRLLPTGTVKLDLLRERSQQSTADTFELNGSENLNTVKKAFDGEYPAETPVAAKRIPPKPKEKPKVVPRSTINRSHDRQSDRTEVIHTQQYDVKARKPTDAVDSLLSSESKHPTEYPEYKYSPRTPPDGTDHPEDSSHKHVDSIDKPSVILRTRPGCNLETTVIGQAKNRQISSNINTAVIRNSSNENLLPSEIYVGVKDKNKTESVGQALQEPCQGKVRGRKTEEKCDRSEIFYKNNQSVSAGKVKPTTAVKAVHPEETGTKTSETLLSSARQVVREYPGMESDTSPREDDIQGVPRTSRSGSLRSTTKESIIESLERKRRESTGNRLKGLQVPQSGLNKKPAGSGAVITNLPTLIKPVAAQGLLAKPKERRSSYTSLMPTPLGTSSLNGPTPYKVPSSMENGKPPKSPGLFKVPAPVPSERNYSSKTNISHMSRSCGQDIPKGKASNSSKHVPLSSSETMVVTNHDNSVRDKNSFTNYSNISDEKSKNEDTLLGNGCTILNDYNNSKKDAPVVSSESVCMAQTTETYKVFDDAPPPPVVNMHTFPPAINTDSSPAQEPQQKPPPPIHRELSLEIDTISEMPRHTIRLPSVKSPSSKTFISPRSSELSPSKDANLNDSVLTAGSSLQSLDTTDTDSLPCSSSSKKMDGFVSPPSPLGISKEDISEGRGSLVSTPDLDLDAPRSPTLSESDSGIFSAKLELKKDAMGGDKYKSPADQGGGRSRISTSSHSSTSSTEVPKTLDKSKTAEPTKTADVTKLPDAPRSQRTSTSTYKFSQSSEAPKIIETSSTSYTASSLNADKPEYDSKLNELASEYSLENDKPKEPSVSSYKSSSYTTTKSDLFRSTDIQENIPASNKTTTITACVEESSVLPKSERVRNSSYRSYGTSSNDNSPRSPSALTPRSKRTSSYQKSEFSPRSSTSTNEISPRSASTNHISPRSSSTNEISPINSSANDISPRSSSSTNELSPRSTSTNELSPRSTSANELSPRSSVISKEEDSKASVDGVVMTSSSVSGAGGVMEVEIVKGAIGLGFCIEGGQGSPKGDMPVLVKRLFKGASAAQGKLQAGDEILKVNGKDMSHMSHYKAWNHLKSLPEGTINMTICRH